MKDANGYNSALLGGNVTLRWEFAEDAGDLDYLVFVNVGHVDYFPQVKFIRPHRQGADPSGKLDAYISQDENFYVTSATVYLDEDPVEAAIEHTRTRTTIRYTHFRPLALGSAHSYRIAYTDSFGVQRSGQIDFTVTTTPFSAGTLFIEAEDFNFDHGKTITELPIGMT